MNRIIKRLIALILCLCLLLPGLSLAEESHAVQFALTADMDPSVYPEQDRKLMEGLAELIDMLSMEGTFQYDEDCFDLDVDFLLDGSEDTRTGLRVYGCETLWGVQSSLMGEETITLNLEALLEFCMKAYFHLDVPLQRLGLLISPYVHTDGLRVITEPWNKLMNAKTSTRTISRAKVLQLAEQLSGVGFDRALTYWIMAVGTESGYDEVIQNTLSTLPQWVDSFLSKKGLTITVKGENETWSTGNTTLFTKTVQDGWTTLDLSLPATPDGYEISGFCAMQDNGETLSINARLTITRDDLSVLDLRLAADELPQVIPASGPFSLSYDATGDAVPGGCHLRFEGESDQGAFTLRQVDSVTGQPMLTLSGTAVSAETTSPLNWGHWDIEGLNFFSVNDMTLAAFVADVQGPMIRGLLPLLAKAPIKACQSLLDLMSDKGILDLLTPSAISGADPLDEGAWDEAGWDEAAWDDAEWDDALWDDDSMFE